MKRTLYTKLLEWKRSHSRKPLFLEGARQVGKTWLLQEFGRNEYKNVAYINCHNNPDVAELFSDFKVDRIIRSIAAIADTVVKPNDTLIILDEIQELEKGLASLKYFCENAPDYHIAVAGSLLGLAYRRRESFPVGKVDILQLYPMTFCEFLEAKGNDAMLELLVGYHWQSQETLANTLSDLLRQYYYVGGMPEAVAEYIKSGNLIEVRKIQKSILHAYSLDFAKHTEDEVQRIRMVWESIPGQLARENKKFIFGAVKKGSRAVYFDKALQWLYDAALIYRVERCRKPDIPLSFYADRDAFKIYLLDVGLLAAMADIPAKQMLLNNSIFSDYNGAFTENYVLQQMLATMPGRKMYYFSKDNSTQEVDFMFQAEERVVPIEVKAEVNVKAKSLSTFINFDFKENHLKGIRLSMLPYKDQGWMVNIPLWAAATLPGYIDKMPWSKDVE